MKINPFTGLALLAAPVAALVYWALLSSDLGPSLNSRDVEGIIAFLTIALLADFVAVDFRIDRTGHQPQSSLAFLPFLGAIALFAPPISVALVGVVVAVSQLILRRNTLSRAFYNVAQAMLSASAAGVTYHLVAPSGGVGFVAFGIAAAVFFTANIVLASIALARLKHERFGTVLQQVTGPNGSNLRYDLLASPIAIVPVLLYETSPVLGILVIVLPLLLINYSYVSKKQVIEAHKDLVRSLVKAIETRDPYTSGHSVRVATLAKSIAHDLKLPASQVDKIEMAALLHDIGKIDPAFSEVLSKPFSLTVEERLLIETHAARGAELLASLSSVDVEVVAAVRHHHERFDGQGYPDRIAAGDIPLAAKIIMLCDSVDAMLSDRPYRKALPIDKVYSELREFSGTQFDPKIVNVVASKGTVGRALALISAEDPDFYRPTKPSPV